MGEQFGGATGKRGGEAVPLVQNNFDTDGFTHGLGFDTEPQRVRREET